MLLDNKKSSAELKVEKPLGTSPYPKRIKRPRSSYSPSWDSLNPLLLDSALVQKLSDCTIELHYFHVEFTCTKFTDWVVEVPNMLRTHWLSAKQGESGEPSDVGESGCTNQIRVVSVLLLGLHS